MEHLPNPDLEPVVDICAALKAALEQLKHSVHLPQVDTEEEEK